MSLSKLDRLAIQKQLQAARAKGMIADAPKAIPSREEASVRRQSIQQRTAEFAQLDYELMSVILDVELNPEIPPIVLQNIVSRRLKDMSENGTTGDIPEVVWEMIEGLNVSQQTFTRFQKAKPAFQKSDRELTVRYQSHEHCQQAISKPGLVVLLNQVSRWRVVDKEIIIEADFVGAFSIEDLEHIWRGCSMS